MTPYCTAVHCTDLLILLRNEFHVHCDYPSELPLKIVILLQILFVSFSFLPKRIITICRSFNFLSDVTIRYKTYLSFSRQNASFQLEIIWRRNA